MAIAMDDAWSESSHGSSRLSQEIFSILESRFLFGAAGPGRVRVLSVDGGGDDAGLLAATALCRLESRLRAITGDENARVADFFDVAAGSGAGAFVAAAVVALRVPAAEVLAMVEKYRKALAGVKRGFFGRRPAAGVFRKVFGELTVRDAAKPLLVPCYDAATAAPFVFSRADAVEGDQYDFALWQVCAAACGAGAASVVSVDKSTSVRTVGGAAAVPNPTAVAVTHVLNNKREFPFAATLDDVFVVSLGSGGGGAAPPGDVVRIAGACHADMVDQSMAAAFGESCDFNYVRTAAPLEERNVKSVLFKGRSVADMSNGEVLDWAAGVAVKEHERRERTKIPTVLIKPSASTPRSSSSSSASTLITVSTASSSDS